MTHWIEVERLKQADKCPGCGSANDAMHFQGWGWLKERLTHCEFWGGGLGGYAQLCYYTNCFLDRVSLWLDNSNPSWPTLYMRNCLQRGGSLGISHRGGVNWYSTVRDSTFDGTSLTIEDHSDGNPLYVDYDYNAFLQGYTHPNMAGDNDVIVTSGFNWQTSWLGNFYLPTNSPLIDAGSRTADLAALYHFTTQTDQIKETDSDVDIGYHYVAVDGYGAPLDYDGDGIPDYFEDTNGNGDDGDDPTSWQDYDSKNGLTGDDGLIVFTPLQ